MSILSCDLPTDNIGIRAISYDNLISTPRSHHGKLANIALTSIITTTNIFSLNALKYEEVTSKEYIEPVAANQVLDRHRQDLTLIAKIHEKSKYVNNWDGNGAKAASLEAINDAETFIWILLKYSIIHSPIISLAADGEINFLWILPGFRLDLGVYGDTTYSYYGKTLNGKEYLADDVDIKQRLPGHIINLILK